MLGKIASLIEAYSGAENAIAQMFTGRQYGGTVPAHDIETMINSPRWAKQYGAKTVKKAWKNIVDNEYVSQKGGMWQWVFARGTVERGH